MLPPMRLSVGTSRCSVLIAYANVVVVKGLVLQVYDASSNSYCKKALYKASENRFIAFFQVVLVLKVLV